MTSLCHKFLLLAVVILSCGFYSIKFDHSLTNKPTNSRIFLVSENVYKAILPDGNILGFLRDTKDRKKLTGTSQWQGSIEKQVITIWSPDNNTKLIFNKGKLTKCVLNGGTFNFTDYCVDEESIKKLANAPKPRETAKGSTADIWRFEKRLRLWFANPNVAGMLLSQIAILCIIVIICATNWKKLLGLFLLLPTLYAVFLTESRSSFLAVIIGAITCLVIRLHSLKIKDLFKIRHIITFLTVLFIFIGVLYCTGKINRFTEGFYKVDQFITMRKEIAKGHLMALADAPWGWHGDEYPGRTACLNWYVPEYKHIVWTHLTQISAWGWFGGGLIIFLWLFTILLTATLEWSRKTPLSCPIIFAYFIGGLFNPVYRNFELFIIPIGALIFTLIHNRITLKKCIMILLISLTSSTIISGLLVHTGKKLRPKWLPKITVKWNKIIINGDNSKIWVVNDNKVLGGLGFPGREIIWYYLRHPKVPPLGFVYRVEDLPKDAEKIAICGRATLDYVCKFTAGEIKPPSNTIFISPAMDIATIPKSLCTATHLVVALGDLAYKRTAEWENLDMVVMYRSGVEFYHPNWMKFVLTN